MAFHPGMAAPPGMPPGQHMAPMNPHTAGPPMGHMQAQGMHPQMHPSMPGPNNAHVSQAGPMMGSMPHAMGPNANAMAHLGAGPQMFPNQQMNQMNAQFMQAQQQQQEQVARSKAIMNSRQQQNPMGMLQGPGQGMNPQHFHNMQQNALRMNIPPHMQNNQQAMMQMMQQSQAGGPHGPLQRQAGPPGGPTPQMRGPPQMQGMHPPQAGPPAQVAPQGHASQMRPQTSSQGLQVQQAQTPNQTQQPHQTPQRQPIAGRHPPSQASPPQPGTQAHPTPQSQPQPEQPVSAAGPQPSLAGMQEHQSRTPQQLQQSSQQGQQANNEMAKHMTQTPMQNQFQRHQMAAARQANHMTLMNEMIAQPAKVKLVLFAEQLGSINSDKGNVPPFESLQQLVSEYFIDHGSFRFNLRQDATLIGHYDIPMSTLARYFLTQFESGVQNIQLTVSRGTIQTDSMSASQIIFCEQATFACTYANNQIIRHKGRLKALLGPQHKFESFEFESNGFEELISSARIRQMLSTESPNSQVKSPTMTKSKTPAKQRGKAPLTRSFRLSESDLPALPARSDGLTNEVFRFMETASIFSQMQSLFDFAHQNKHVSATVAMQKFNEANQGAQIPIQSQQMNAGLTGAQAAAMAAAGQSNPQVNFPAAVGAHNGFPHVTQFGIGGMRPQPGMHNQFTSPATNHLGLPNATNSPHMRQGGSPAQPGLPPHMQTAPMAPQMVAQHSMQGTNSSAPSSNASPNAANKKRHASGQIKVDGATDPGGAPHMNGVVPNPKQQTPKMGNQPKRPRAG